MYRTHIVRAARFLQGSTCCNADLQKVTNFTIAPYAAPAPLLCTNAEPQAPRDLSTGATGHRTPKATVLNDFQAHFLPYANLHFHLGAEHKSDEYNDAADSVAYDAAAHAGRRLAAAPRPGFMCPTGGLSASELQAYTFHHCTGDVAVGKTYEIHYVHSAAGSGTDVDPELTNGLTAAAGFGFRKISNPMVAVEAMVVQIVNSADASVTYDDLLHGWEWKNHSAADTKMYTGSTTGTSWDNNVCSPFIITWHVDKRCHKVSAASFDKMCQDMKTKGLTNEVYPHASRTLVDPQHVVAPQYVYDFH